jgi:hypothetical protein
MFVNSPINFSSNQATYVATMPIPIAMSDIGITLAPVVKSPSSSARLVFLGFNAGDGRLIRGSLNAVYSPRWPSATPQEKDRRSAAPANAVHGVLAKSVLRVALVPAGPREHPPRYVALISRRGQPVGSLIQPYCDAAGKAAMTLL